ncbi:MAG: hypothetical protein LV481_09785 [Methylacidiphilales bacterium]|nr:hypothetical protein [Candidatus Methylacidiphilales bacterium]
MTKASEELLLADIQEAAENTPDEHKPTTLTLRRFAMLLVVLSRKAELSSQRLERYTVILVRVTVVLAIIAATTIAVAILQLYITAQPPK